MTAILGVKKVLANGETKVIIGSDSLFARGTSKIKASNRGKLIRFPHFVVGFSGLCTMQMVLSDLTKEKAYMEEAFMRMECLDHAIEFAQICFTEIRNRIEDSGSADDLINSIGELVIASYSGLYNVDRYGFGSEHDSWTTSGCADDLLNGSMAVMYPTIGTLEDLQNSVTNAIMVACEYSTGCEGPVKLEVIEKYEQPKPKRRSRKKS